MKRYPYPGNLMSRMKWNELMHDCLDYAVAEEKDVPGLELLMRKLTERERLFLVLYYKEGWSKAQLAEASRLSVKRIGNIIDTGVRKLARVENTDCPRMDYEDFLKYAKERSDREERRYCGSRHIADGGHLYYQDIHMIGLPAHAENALRKAGICRVREMLVSFCSGSRVRNVGEGSWERIRVWLEDMGFLPDGFPRPYGRFYFSESHCSWCVFEALNGWRSPKAEDQEI